MFLSPLCLAPTKTRIAASLLIEGTVLFTGAQLHGIPITSGAELYDPVLGDFVYAGNMTTLPNKATLLNDGKVLITGAGPSFSRTSSAELYVPGAPMLSQQAIAAMKIAAGNNSLNFWQWAWFWQRSTPFPGAPTGFGVYGSFDNTPAMIDKIIASGGGAGPLIVSAEGWVRYFRQVFSPPDPWRRAIAALKIAAEGTVSTFAVGVVLAEIPHISLRAYRIRSVWLDRQYY